MIFPRTKMPGLLAALTAAAVTCTGCPVWQEEDTPVSQFRQTVPGSSADYYLYVPSDYDSARSWPLVVTLHGTPGFDGPEDQAREWKGLAEKNGFIVLAPRLASAQGVLPVPRGRRLRLLAEDEENVLAALDQVWRKYTINPAAVMITGFSAGGYPLYYIALRNPDRFTALAARMCNSDIQALKDIPVTPSARRMPMLLYFAKTGSNPISSKLDPIANQTWAAFRQLRTAGCTHARIRAVEGGHQRDPLPAWEFFHQQLTKVK